jgi:hypothetical protein
MKTRALALLVFAMALAPLYGMTATGESASLGPGLYPDMRTVIPLQIGIQNKQQREILRFSNGIANTGPGPWAMRPQNSADATTAIQEIRDANNNVVQESARGTFEYHPAHRHWHMGNIALFELRKGSPTGAIQGLNSIKVTFCLIDWYALEGNSNTKERLFWDCQTSYQGISSGWVDQYHQSVEGQQLDITDVPDGNDYYLVSTSNYNRTYLESNYSNNTAWVRLAIGHDSQGNRKATVIGNSACDSPGLCGVGAPNR